MTIVPILTPLLHMKSEEVVIADTQNLFMLHHSKNEIICKAVTYSSYIGIVVK